MQSVRLLAQLVNVSRNYCAKPRRDFSKHGRLLYPRIGDPRRLRLDFWGRTIRRQAALHNTSTSGATSDSGMEADRVPVRWWGGAATRIISVTLFMLIHPQRPYKRYANAD